MLYLLMVLSGLLSFSVEGEEAVAVESIDRTLRGAPAKLRKAGPRPKILDDCSDVLTRTNAPSWRTLGRGTGAWSTATCANGSPKRPVASTNYLQQVPITTFYLDPVGKPYFLLANDRLVTANQLGRTAYSYFDSSLGAPDVIDVRNPFSIIVYYQDYGTVVLLDRNLSEKRRIDLFAVEDLRQPGTLARGINDDLWVFDSWDYRLKLFDNRLEVERETNDLRLDLGLAAEPDRILVSRNTVSLYFAEDGRLATFDRFGRFLRWTDLPAPAARVDWNAPNLLIRYADGAAVAWSPAEPTLRSLDPLPPSLADRPVYVGTDGFITLGPAGLTTLVLPPVDRPER